MLKQRITVLLLTVLLAAALVPTITPAAAAPDARQDEPVIRFAVLPVLDVLPLYVADAENFFADEGITVEMVPVNGPAESAQLLLAGEVDGVMTDLIVAAIFNQEDTFVQVVAQSRRAYPEHPLFRVLSSPESEVTTPEAIVDVPIGISQNTVIEYITQRILENEGLTRDQLEFVAEPNIPVRFQLMMEGSLPAATLPDPLAQAAIEGGANLVADDSALSESQLSQSVIVFRTAFLDENADTVQAFLRAWMNAAEAINQDPEGYRELWIEKTNVPDSVKDTYVLPPFPTYDITQPEAWADVNEWLVDSGTAENEVSYEDTVNPTYLDVITPEEEMPADGEDGDMAAGDPANGEALFASTGCTGCHVLEGDATVGPSLEGIGTTAATRVEGMSAAEYLHESIVAPGEFIVEGYNNIMPPYDTLPEGDLNDIVAYLLTLE